MRVLKSRYFGTGENFDFVPSSLRVSSKKVFSFHLLSGHIVCIAVAVPGLLSCEGKTALHHVRDDDDDDIDIAKSKTQNIWNTILILYWFLKWYCLYSFCFLPKVCLLLGIVGIVKCIHDLTTWTWLSINLHQIRLFSAEIFCSPVCIGYL